MIDININYSLQLEQILKTLSEPPRLLLHSCCAPCSSYVLEYLSPYFQIVDYYYNPNIEPAAEYDKRACELRRLTEQMPLKNKVEFICADYNPHPFHNAIKGFEQEPEGGKRCLICYRLRLEESAKKAKELGCDWFGTTLTISPLKNAKEINRIGFELQEQYGIQYLPSDFKKKNGYKRSIELSAQYDLYRQNYCGCIFSKK